ncbi:hypothetical protein CR513_19880, partial [Mucuna pruriens]
MLAGSRLFTNEVHSGWNYKASDQASFPSKVRLRGMLSGSRSWRRRVLRSTLSVKVSNGNLPSNTKMILGPGFIPPTQLLLFQFLSHHLHIFHPFPCEMTVMSVEGMHECNVFMELLKLLKMQKPSGEKAWISSIVE